MKPLEINYISLINWFWENVPFLDGYKPDYGILFLAITDSINHSRWSANTPIPYDRLTSKSQLGKKTYLEGRKWLQEKGLISFVSGKNEYAVATFSLGAEVQKCTAISTATDTAINTASDTTAAPLSAPLSAPSIINNKHKTNKPKKKEPSESELSVHALTKAVFMNDYKNRKGSEYIWSKKDGAMLKDLISKLTSKLRTKEPDFDPEAKKERIPNGLKFLLTGVKKGSWYDEHFEIAILNSKFNEIYAIALKEKEQRDNAAKPKRTISDAIIEARGF